jgi:hypothetical protein
MRRQGLWRALVALSILQAIALSLVSPALATQPEVVHITTAGSIVGGTQVGTFVATGAIADQGTYAFHEDVHHDFAFGGVGAPTFGIVRSLEFFSGEAGDFTLQNVVKFSLTDTPDLLTVVGTWAVASGTGDYVDLHGQGTITGTIAFTDDDEIFAFEFSGSAHHD